MLPIFTRLAQLWRDKVIGPELRTYDAARDELGGAPWREEPSTAQWFVASGPIKLNPIGASDSSELCSERTTERPHSRMKALLIGGAAGLVAVVIFVAALWRVSASPHNVTTELAMQAKAISAVGVKASPDPTATAGATVPPARVASNFSPSVKKLFGGEDEDKSPALKTKKKKHLKRRHHRVHKIGARPRKSVARRKALGHPSAMRLSAL